MSNPYQHKFSASNQFQSSTTFSPYFSATKFSSPASNPSNPTGYNPYDSTIPNPYDSPIPNPYDAPIPNPYDVVASKSTHPAADTQAPKPKLTKFNVSGTTVTFPTELIISKAPYSKLADLAGGYLTTLDSEEEGFWIDANLDGFKILLEYLRYDTLYIPTAVPKAMVKRVFRDMGVDWPGGTGQISTTPPPAPAQEDDYTPEMLAALREIEKDLVSVDKKYPQPSSRARVHAQAGSSSGVRNSPGVNLPSYEEVQYSDFSSYGTDIKRQYSPAPATASPPAQSFHTVVTSSLDTQVTDLLLSHITPQLEAQAKMGILRGSVVVVPPSKPSTYSNIYSNTYSTAREKEEDEEIVSSITSVLGDNISGAAWCKVLRLPTGIGADGSITGTYGNVTMAFISQPEAIKEIRRRLIRALNTGPGGVYDDADELLNHLYDYKKPAKSALGAAEYPPLPPSGILPPGGGSALTEIMSELSGPILDVDEARHDVREHYSNSKNSTFYSRLWKRGSVADSSAKLQRRQVQQPQQVLVSEGHAAVVGGAAPVEKLEPKKGSVLVDVASEDIHVRKLSDLGLYETVTLKGVIVRVEVMA